MTDNDKIVRFLEKSKITVQMENGRIYNVVEYARKILAERGDIEWRPMEEDE